MARVQVSPARSTTAPAHRGGIGGWILAGIVAVVLAIAAYVVVAGGGTRYNAPATTPAPATAAPANAPGAPAPAPAAPAPQMSAAPAPPRYP
jgi:hypothetical protein